MATILKFSYLKSQTLSAKIYSEDMTTLSSTVAPAEKTVSGNPSGVYWLSFDTQLSSGNYCITVENSEEEVILFDLVEWDGVDVLTNTEKVKLKTDKLTFTQDNSIVSVLSSEGLDNIGVTEPTGVASTFREVIIQIWMRFFNKVTKDSSSIVVYNSSGNPQTTQSITEGASSQILNKATGV